ncbi:MAG TPA: hypothetical protein VEL81_00580 [Thermoplasmata archaeon]|nr:hypothetical protein [Thermoplasmata archaeon]
MADLAVQLLTLALQGVIVATFLIVALTFVTFRKMNKEVRRARMFILADRMERFLAAFTVAFLFLTAALISSAAGFPLPAPVSSIVVFVWLGGILYGAFEIFFAMRPRSRWKRRLTHRSAVNRTRPLEASSEASGDAPK